MTIPALGKKKSVTHLQNYLRVKEIRYIRTK